MKNPLLTLRTALLLFLLVSIAGIASAHDIEVDGIYYNITSENTVAVTYPYEGTNSSPYSGNITIPDQITYNGNTYSVTSIGQDAFYGCTGLTEITIPESVTSIGYYAFTSCTGLTSVTIGNSVTSIGRGAFLNCTGLTEITIPESVTSIGEAAFYYCTGLSEITIPNSVTTIGDRVFEECSGLTEITIPESVTSIGYRAFTSCTGLTSVTIGNSVTTIGREAFRRCTGLTEITIPESVTSIGQEAFYGCTGLTEIIIPGSVTSIGSEAFSGCTGLKSVYYNIANITSFDSYSSHPFYNCPIERIVIGNNVTTIPQNFARNLTSLTSVTIGNSVISIGSYAFYSCTGLSEITIPESVTTIGQDAFYGCTGLTEIIIPEPVTSIGSEAFSGCTGLKTVYYNAANINSFGSGNSCPFYNCPIEHIVIGENVTTIPKHFAYSLTSLTSVTIGNSVTSIGQEAFYGCTGLTEIIIPESVTSIGSEAFSGCTGLKQVYYNAANIASFDIRNSQSHPFYNCPIERIVIGENVTTIPKYFAYNLTSLTNVTIGNSVTSIGDLAFNGCTGMSNIIVSSGNTKYDSRNNCNAIIETASNTLFVGCKRTIIPISVTSIGDFAFRGCTGLTEITIPDAVTSIGGSAFYSCTGLTSVTIGNSVTSIGNSAFYGCTGLTKITIPDAVTSIGGSAFYSCTGLTSVTIGNSVTTIGNSAFRGCTGLTKITIPDAMTSIGDYAFQGCTGLKTVYYNAMNYGSFSFSYSNHDPFYNCPIERIVIGNNVTTIPRNFAHNLTGLTSVTIGNSVTTISEQAFSGCTGLTSVTCWASAPPTLGSYVFSQVPSEMIVFVPASSIGFYEVANGWKQFEILPIMSNVIRLTVNLPSNVNVADYAQMRLNLDNSGKHSHLIITDKSNYIFGGIEQNSVCNVTLQNQYGDVFGKIENIQVGEENVEVTFASLFKPQNVHLIVNTPVGQNMTSQSRITWLDENGELLMQGDTIKRLPPGRKLKYQVTLTQELAMAYSLPASTSYTVKDGDNTVVCQLTAISQTTLSGKVKDASNNQPLYGATLSAVQSFGGSNTVTLTAPTNNQGQYALDASSVPTTLTVAASGYISQTIDCDMTSAGNTVTVPDVALQPITGAVVNVNLTFTPAHIYGEAVETQNWYSDYNNVDYTVYNKTKNRVISDIHVQYPQIVLMEDVNDGDLLEITATSRKDAFMPVKTTVTIAEQKANATFDIVEKGQIAASFAKNVNPQVTGTLYDVEEKLVKTADYSGSNLTFEELADGDYKLVTMGKCDFFNSIYDLSQLSAVGLQAGTDYVENTVNVENGLIRKVNIAEVPFFDETKFYYTGENTSFTVNKPSVVIGNYLTFRARIDFKDEFKDKVNDVQLIVDLPESCQFYENSVMVGASVADYMKSGNQIIVPLTNYDNLVRFCAIPTVAGDFAPSAFVQFTLNGKTIKQPIGAASFTAEGLSIRVPSTTSMTEIPVCGSSIGVCDIEIYDNDVLIGETTSLANGTWSTKCELYNPFNLSTHDIYAKLKTSQGIELQSEIKSCLYDRFNPQLWKVTMINTAHPSSSLNLCQYTTVFDFIDPILDQPAYWYWPSYPDFTFLVDFTNNDTTVISDVVLLVKLSDGSWDYLKPVFDLNQGKWIASTNYRFSSKLPVNVAVAYNSLNDESIFDADVMTNEILKFSSFQDEIRASDQIFDSLVEQYQNAEDSGDGLAAEALIEEIAAYLGLEETEIPEDYDEEEFQQYLAEAIALDDTLQLICDNIRNLTIYDETITEYMDNCLIEHTAGLTVEQLLEEGYEAVNKTDGTSYYILFGDDCIKFVDFATDVYITFNQSDIDQLLRGSGEDWLRRFNLLGDRIQQASDMITNGFLLVIKYIDSRRGYIQYQHELYAKQVNYLRYDLGLDLKDPRVKAVRQEQIKLLKISNRYSKVKRFFDKYIEPFMKSKGVKIAGKSISVLNALVDYKDAIDNMSKLILFKNNIIPPCEEANDAAESLKKDIIKSINYTGVFYGALLTSDVAGMLGLGGAIAALIPSGGTSTAAIVASLVGIAAKVGGTILFEKKYDKTYKKFVNRRQNLDKLCQMEEEPDYQEPDYQEHDYYEEYPDRDIEPVLDPSGFVYEGVPSNRLQGVTATCYYKETVEDMYGDQHEEVVLWDAEQYGQENPLLTDENGYYRWDVPIGMWQVKYEKEGYETTYSDWLPVPPPQLDVNIGMVQMRQPEVIKAHAYPKAVELEFDKFMIPETLTPDNIIVSVNGSSVSGTIELLNAELDDPNAITSIRRAPGTGLTFASRVRFNASSPFNASQVTLHVKQDVESYAGLQMNEDYEAVLDIELEMQEIVADSVVIVPYLESKQLTVAVLPAAASAGKVLNVASTSTMIATTDAEQYTLDNEGKAVITVHGDLPGMTSLLYSFDGYDLTAATLINVMMESQMTVATPTASIASGSEVEKGMAVYLRCATEGATIYYTLDGSCPCDNTPARKVYDGSPIIINSTVTIKAIATAEGLYDSNVATFVYRVNEGKKGDINGDGEINIADINAGIDIILGGQTDSDTRARADVNDDNEINIADINALIDIILNDTGSKMPKVNCSDLLHIDDVAMKPGDVRMVNVTLDNAMRYSAMQCDIVMPAGLALVDVYSAGANNSKSSRLDESTSRAVTYSMGKLPFVSDSQPVMTFTVRADAALEAESEIRLTNVVLADGENKAWRIADATALVNNASGINDLTAATDRVWIEEHTLCIEAHKDGIARIASVNGVVREISVKAGVTSYELESGIYVVVLNGKSHKIAIK